MKTMTIGVATMALTAFLTTSAFGQDGNKNQRRLQGVPTPPVSQLTKTGSGTLTLSSRENETSLQTNTTSEHASAAATTHNAMESFNFGFGVKASAESQTGQTQSLADFNGDGRVDAADFRSPHNTNSPQNQNERNVIMANTEGDAHLAGPLDHSQTASNSSSGSNVSQSPRPTRNVNVPGTNNLTATTYGRGSFRQSRGK